MAAGERRIGIVVGLRPRNRRFEAVWNIPRNDIEPGEVQQHEDRGRVGRRPATQNGTASRPRSSGRRRASRPPHRSSPDSRKWMTSTTKKKKALITPATERLKNFARVIGANLNGRIG